VIFSAHEIRHLNERDIFFAELKRVLKNKGNIVITEHLRDLPNMLAYNIGFFHFMSGALWRNTFKKSGLVVCEEFNFTPFITTFILAKYEN